MSYRRTPFFRLVFTLASVLTVSSVAFIIVGFQGFRYSQDLAYTQIQRHSLAALSAKVRTAVREKEYERALELLRPLQGREKDDVSRRYLRELEAGLSAKRPSQDHLRELAEGWQVYQSNEVLRSVDDLQMAFRSLVLQGWVIWVGFVLLSIFIMNQIIRTLVRPLRYLERYFKKTNHSESIPLLFDKEADRRDSGVAEASREITRLFDGVEKLIRNVREANDQSQSQLLRQKIRAEALASVSRDAVFFSKAKLHSVVQQYWFSPARGGEVASGFSDGSSWGKSSGAQLSS